MAQRWEHLPPSAVAGVRFPDLALLVGKFVVDSRPRSEGFSPVFFFLPPHVQKQMHQIPVLTRRKWGLQVCQLCCFISVTLTKERYLFFVIFYACSLPHLCSCKKGYASDFTVVSAWGANPCRYYTASKVIVFPLLLRLLCYANKLEKIYTHKQSTQQTTHGSQDTQNTRIRTNTGGTKYCFLLVLLLCFIVLYFIVSRRCGTEEERLRWV